MNFTWVAEDYFQNSQFQYDHAQRALSQYQFQSDETVLDVGCGDGKITAEIANKAPNGHVVGIDSSEHMIKFANSEFGSKSDNLEFLVARAESFSYTNKFDLIVSFACLHWVKDQLSFLNAANNALKNNGKIILTLYPKHPYIWDSIEETISLPAWKEYFVGYKNPHISYDIDIYRNLCEQANLNIQYLKEEMPIANFKTVEGMEDFLKSWLPHTDQVHPYLRTKFISNIGNIFLKKISYKKSDTLIGMPFRRLDALLSKKF